MTVVAEESLIERTLLSLQETVHYAIIIEVCGLVVRLDCSCGTGFMLTSLVGDERDKKPGKVSHEVPQRVDFMFCCIHSYINFLFSLIYWSSWGLKDTVCWLD